MRNKLLLTYILFFLGIGYISMQAQTLLNIKKFDGTDKFLNLTTLGKITFSDVNLILNYSVGNDEPVTLSSVKKIVFTQAAGVTQIMADRKAIRIYPNPATTYIELKNTPEGELNVAVYSVAGSLVLNLQLDSDSRQINVSGLPKGLYLIKVNNQVAKFSKI
ncbi:T9SS type A sorting domain-containing protein [Parabacteroides sp. FAFU027]|uniref:T9SS type A sorting domain-containing protein n=1 Tax=Parabacteroides sp. FAFU027 TaxID=2922715 RepID=UPI001FAF17FE|nr:T9SS type A sorting domain-containing protein [Parabacteroides sp. FAFU027]